MTEREIDDMLWRAFYLGSRVMASHIDRDIPFSEIGKLASVLREIAESEATLHDPTALTAKFPDMAGMFQRIGTLNIRNDRELAQRIFRGFMIATDAKE